MLCPEENVTKPTNSESYREAERKVEATEIVLEKRGEGDKIFGDNYSQVELEKV